MSTLSRPVDPKRKHRREVWTRIVAPVVLSFLALIALCVALVIGVATGALVHKQVAIIMSVVATVFLALPMMILCLVPYFILAFTAVGAGRLHANVHKPLRGARRLSGSIAERTKQIMPRLAQPVAAFNVWVTRLEHTVRGLSQPAAVETNDEIDGKDGKASE
ncbi:MAG: hypothetical protein JW966_03575 [Anaerolineae bacterium]|nr:hypothetical protein [Anaerolineae bacterium]